MKGLAAVALVMLLLVAGCAQPADRPDNEKDVVDDGGPPPGGVGDADGPDGAGTQGPAAEVAVTFRAEAPDIDVLNIRWPVFWGPIRTEDTAMEKVGDRFEATVHLPAGALVRYFYSVPTFDYDHREQFQPEWEVNRHIVVTEGLVVEDTIYAWGPEEVDRPARLHGLVTDAATGEQVLEPIIVADGILASAMNGSYDVAVRDRSMLVTVFSPDGRYHAKTFAVAPGRSDIALEPAAQARVTIHVDADPPPYHEVRLYGTADQFGGRLIGRNGFTSDTFLGVDGSVELDLYEGQWVDTLYTVGNEILSHEMAPDAPPCCAFWTIRGFQAQDGLVLQHDLAPFRDDDALTLDVTVPSHTDASRIGVSGIGPRLLYMHPAGDDRWTLRLSGQDLQDRPYRFYKQWAGVGDETRSDRTIDGTHIEDTATWRHDAGPLPVGEYMLPAIENRFALHAILPDWWSTTHAMNAERFVELSAENGYHGILPAQVWGYDRLEPEPSIVRNEPISLYTPQSELERITGLAHDQGLDVAVLPQLGGAEHLLHEPQEFSTEWWDAWFPVNRAFNVHNARAAEAAGIEILGLRAKEQGFALPAGYTDRYDEEMHKTVAAMRGVYDGRIVAFYDRFMAGVDYWEQADLIVDSPAVLDVPDDPTQSVLDAAAATRLDEQYDDHYQATGLPVWIILGFHNVDGAANGATAPEEDGPHTPQNHDYSLDNEEQRMLYEAYLKAANQRPWIDGVVVFATGPTDAPQARDLVVQGKPAQEYLKQWAQAIDAAGGPA